MNDHILTLVLDCSAPSLPPFVQVPFSLRGAAAGSLSWKDVARHLGARRVMLPMLKLVQEVQAKELVRSVTDDCCMRGVVCLLCHGSICLLCRMSTLGGRSRGVCTMTHACVWCAVCCVWWWWRTGIAVSGARRVQEAGDVCRTGMCCSAPLLTRILTALV